MPLGVEVDLGPGDIALDGDPLPPKNNGGTLPPNFGPCIVTRRLHGMRVGLGPGHIVLHGDPAPPPPKKGAQQPPIFGPCLLWPNGWIDPAATWYGGRP